jgi:hypothetical protein
LISQGAADSDPERQVEIPVERGFESDFPRQAEPGFHEKLLGVGGGECRKIVEVKTKWDGHDLMIHHATVCVD